VLIHSLQKSEVSKFLTLLMPLPLQSLTAHMGSMSVDCRTRMEIEATEEAVRFLMGKELESEVPQEEYDVQGYGL
jgi:lactate dehydrogenase-like 2-hydroxyacid dehydrogenase